MLRLVPSSDAQPAREREPRHADELSQVAAAAVRGDRSAVHALLVALAPHLLRTVRSVLGRDSGDVDDVAQEAALVVLGALPGFRGESSVVRFAMRTAVLVAMNARRKRGASKRGGGLAADPAAIDEVAAPHDNPEQHLASARAANAVRQLLSTLPASQAEALALHCIAGCTLAEIASATHSPQETVKSRLRLARQALRHTLERTPAMVELLEGDT
jgi:RNA polymerase sigma factor (sigma-70 family)